MNQIEQNTVALEALLNEVNNLPDAEGGGGIDTSDATATADDILVNKTAYANGTKITGTIPLKTATDMTTSGATVVVSPGYYATAVEKSVTTATQATPTISVNNSGLIIASVTQTEGYVTAGTKRSTNQLNIQAEKTITPTESTQTAVTSGVYTTGVVTVGAIPSDYIVTEELNVQDSLITQIRAALEGKTGGGSDSGAIETCQVSITFDSTVREECPVFYTALDTNNELVDGIHWVRPGETKVFTAVQNSLMVVANVETQVQMLGFSVSAGDFSWNALSVHGIVPKISTLQIRIWDDD